MARNWELEAECKEYGESWRTDERKKPFGKNKHLWVNVWCRLTAINPLFPVLECLLEVSANLKSNLITISYLNIYLNSWLTFSVTFSIQFSGNKMLRWLAVWIASSSSQKSQYIALSLHKIALLQMSKSSVEEPFKAHQLDSTWMKIHLEGSDCLSMSFQLAIDLRKYLLFLHFPAWFYAEDCGWCSQSLKPVRGIFLLFQELCLMGTVLWIHMNLWEQSI